MAAQIPSLELVGENVCDACGSDQGPHYKHQVTRCGRCEIKHFDRRIVKRQIDRCVIVLWFVMSFAVMAYWLLTRGFSR